MQGKEKAWRETLKKVKNFKAVYFHKFCSKWKKIQHGVNLLILKYAAAPPPPPIFLFVETSLRIYTLSTYTNKCNIQFY